MRRVAHGVPIRRCGLFDALKEDWKRLGRGGDLFRRARQPNDARIEQRDVFGECWGRVSFRVDCYENRLDLGGIVAQTVHHRRDLR